MKRVLGRRKLSMLESYDLSYMAGGTAYAVTGIE